MKIERLDHIVLTVKDIDKTISFYKQIIGMEVLTFGTNRKGIAFGEQQINLQEIGEKIQPRAYNPTSGSADFCLIATSSIKEVIDHLQNSDVEIEEGPIKRSGALGEMMSVYFRDPDNNLVEVSNYIS